MTIKLLFSFSINPDNSGTLEVLSYDQDKKVLYHKSGRSKTLTPEEIIEFKNQYIDQMKNGVDEMFQEGNEMFVEIKDFMKS